MIKLAESSGTVAFENDGKLYISKKSGQWTSVFLFVVTLLGVISLANAVLQLFVFNYQGSLGIGIVLLILGSLMILLFVAVRKYRKKLNSIPLNELQNVCIIDLVNNKLINSEKKVVCSLNEVVLSRKCN